MNNKYEDKEKQSEYIGWYKEGYNAALNKIRDFLTNEEKEDTNE